MNNMFANRVRPALLVAWPATSLSDAPMLTSTANAAVSKPEALKWIDDLRSMGDLAIGTDFFSRSTSVQRNATTKERFRKIN